MVTSGEKSLLGHRGIYRNIPLFATGQNWKNVAIISTDYTWCTQLDICCVTTFSAHRQSKLTRPTLTLLRCFLWLVWLVSSMGSETGQPWSKKIRIRQSQADEDRSWHHHPPSHLPEDGAVAQWFALQWSVPFVTVQVSFKCFHVPPQSIG